MFRVVEASYLLKDFKMCKQYVNKYKAQVATPVAKELESFYNRCK